MPKVIHGKDVVLTGIHLVSITFAYEKHGDPPVPTLMQITTYDILDEHGQVYERKSIGQLAEAQRTLVNPWLAAEHALAIEREGL